MARIGQTSLEFNPRNYPSPVAALLADRLNELGPGEPNLAIRKELSSMTPERLVTGPVADRNMAQACLAGLWLYHDFADESHRISQDLETTTGSYWHGILHRREPDFANANYWFRRVGQHPVFVPLGAIARELAAAEPDLDPAARYLVEQTGWNATRFIDHCEAVLRGRAKGEDLCRQIQLREWQLLFDYCYRAAGGAAPAQNQIS